LLTSSDMPRPSKTQDVYMGRKAIDPRSVAALGEAFGHGEAGVPDEPPEAKMGIKWVCGYLMDLAALREGGLPTCRPVTCTDSAG
jgi:hypothetical protein